MPILFGTKGHKNNHRGVIARHEVPKQSQRRRDCFALLAMTRKVKVKNTKLEKSKICNLQSAICNSRRSGFTLLEVLVAVAILGIAVTVVLQLFSADLRSISASEDYVAASTKADVKIRELLADDNLSEMSSSEITEEGDRMDISITDALKDRTENLQVRLLEIDVTIHWTRGTKEKSLTLRTLKVVEKEI
jgi:prepilin-type N-terminal cleavage/methylation domain-containing protein